MSFITQLLTLLNWKVRQQSDSRQLGRRTQSYGGNESSASVESEREREQSTEVRE